ncbi:52 kDa repressor of the inhibitor of the protein kinase-like [Centruroides vittatus]|uniref:52 kDa repressor of the inhibitor of the protein kinase-like n=1 Tax=Centruroides vittatus TaxID=120091 RepID=UPI00350F7E41
MVSKIRKKREQNRQYALKLKEKRRLYNSMYYEEHKQEIKERVQARYRLNKLKELAKRNDRKRYSKYTGNETCSAFSCNNSRKTFPKKSFFRFPRDKIRCRMWLKNCKRKDLLKVKRKYLYTVHRVCEDHFEERMFLNSLRNRLHHNAIPTLFEITTIENMVDDKDGIPEINSEINQLSNENFFSTSEDEKPSILLDSEIIKSTVKNNKFEYDEDKFIFVEDNEDTEGFVEKKWCAAVNCEHEVTAQPEGIYFFEFPNNFELCKKWAMHCRRTDLMNINPEYLHNNFVLCSSHFDSTEFINDDGKVLKTDAVPKVESLVPLFSQS